MYILFCSSTPYTTRYVITVSSGSLPLTLFSASAAAACLPAGGRQAGRRVIYTTNAIEKISAAYRKLNRRRSVFPSSRALLLAFVDLLNTSYTPFGASLLSRFLSAPPKHFNKQNFRRLPLMALFAASSVLLLRAGRPLPRRRRQVTVEKRVKLIQPPAVGLCHHPYIHGKDYNRDDK